LEDAEDAVAELQATLDDIRADDLATKRVVWPDVIVFFKPDVDRNLGLFDAVEPRRISSFDT
jgi:hypothetical protein